MNSREIANTILWYGYANAEEGKEKRRETVEDCKKIIDEHVKEQLNLYDVVGTFCDCAAPDPIDPFAEVDKDTCRKCKNFIV